jgi:mannitol-1-/sugar-/sorbitol-6-/2-deoxyglucose-6-phosphatase
MIKAVIFDMDGLLINSEPFWQKAEIEVFKLAGIELTKTMCHQTMGLRIDEAILYWHKIFGLKKYSAKQVQELVMDKVVEYIVQQGGPLRGVIDCLDFFEEKNIPIAIASSSYYKIIDAVVKKLNISSYFDLIVSAQDTEYGKPHPGIFIETAKRLQIAPQQCLVFEDSANGVLAALSAQMKVVAVPDNELKNKKEFLAADLVIDSLEKWNENLWSKFL